MLATDSDAMYEYARNVGRENPDRAWILDPRDVWIKNPFYNGPSTRHPEDEGDSDESVCSL
jgi:hypothetical protein